MESLGILDGFPKLLFVGGICRRKGADLLPPIFSAILATHPHATLTVVGRRPFPDAEEVGIIGEIETTLADAFARGQIRILDATGRVEDYMRTADVFLFPSRREGFGSVVIESMACGLPVVALRLPGITDYIITDGADGLIVEEDRPADFIRGIRRLIDDRDFYERVVTAGLRTVVDRFSDHAIDAEYKKWYIRVAAA
jgi:glycosyltransferase involved in cell wall biosynthesis